jgi:lactoylglutathione lyase
VRTPPRRQRPPERNTQRFPDGTAIHVYRIKVGSLDTTISELAARGIGAEAPESPDGSGEFRTTWVTDRNGNRIELVQWPAGHADGITAADRAE